MRVHDNKVYECMKSLWKNSIYLTSTKQRSENIMFWKFPHPRLWTDFFFIDPTLITVGHTLLRNYHSWQKQGPRLMRWVGHWGNENQVSTRFKSSQKTRSLLLNVKYQKNEENRVYYPILYWKLIGNLIYLTMTKLNPHNAVHIIL